MEKTLDQAKLLLMMNTGLVFYSQIMCSMKWVKSSEVESVQVEGFLVTYNEEWIEQYTAHDQVYIILRLVLYVAMQHAYRQEWRELKKWQMACNYWVNSYLVDQLHFNPPPNFKLDIHPQYNWEMSVEEIYRKLDDQQKQDGKEPEHSAGDPMAQSLQPPGSGDPDDNSDEGKAKAKARSMSQQDAMDQLVKADAAAKMSGQDPGNIPDEFKIQLDEYLNPVLPWEVIFQKYMSERCKDDYSWKKRNRRYRDIYMPSAYSEQMGGINIYVDSSCSVSDERFSMQAGQIQWIKENLNPKFIRVIVFNTRITQVWEIGDDEPYEVEYVGRGGTDIGECVRHMEENDNVECHIMFTDGYFHQYSLEDVNSDVIAMIYDQDNFTYPGMTEIFHID